MSRRLLIFTRRKISSKMPRQFFSELPVAVRKRFHGSPLEFLSFVDQLDQPEVYSEAQALGLLKPMASNLAADAAAAAGPSGSPRAAAAVPAAASVDLKGVLRGRVAPSALLLLV